MHPPAVETFELDSFCVGDRLAVAVAAPAGPTGTEPWPVVCALDPAFTFATTTAACGWLATASRLAGGDVPPAIVVGVGYPTDDLGALLARRARDLTPTDGPPPEAIQLPPFPLGLGGAGRFLDALTEEVMPAVEARHAADPRDRTLLGYSFGGLFALSALLSRPDAFHRYLVVSPSLWWDDRVVLRLEEAWAEAHDDLPAQVFLAVGGDEQTPGRGWRNEGFSDGALLAARQVDNLRDLGAQLGRRRYPGLRLVQSVLDGEHHLTILAAAVTRGLLALFSDGVRVSAS